MKFCLNDFDICIAKFFGDLVEMYEELLERVVGVFLF